MDNAKEIVDSLRCGQSGCPCQNARLGKGNVHCPAHSDPGPSLSITDKDGKLLVHCHGGCGGVSVITVLRERGLWPEPGGKGDRAKRRTRGKKTRYEIRSPDGVLIAVHVRDDRPEGKRMWWERPDGNTGLGGLETPALPHYGSETLSALADGAEVVVTEGEKAAEALRDLGIEAVGTVTGAGGTPGDDALGPLVRLSVVLWPDNDDLGRQHMNRIAARLAVLGCMNVRVVDWLEAPTHGGDAADAVATKVDVHRLITDAASWKPGDVDLADLLNDVATFIRQYVVLTEHQLWTLALWTAHTYALDAAECTPYLSIKSAEKRSGKTLLLEVLSLLVARPWCTGRVTAAVLVRKVAKDSPTLLLDETDAAFKGDKEYSETLRGVLNSGYRRGGVASLCVKVGGDFDLRDFPVFGAKALAGIGKLPDTVQDRSIPIELRRKARNEHAKRFRMRDAKLDAAQIGESLDCWAVFAVPILVQARPKLPEELGDRAADVWEPLLAIADMAGRHWPERARQAALSLSAATAQEDDSIGVTLLQDIRKAFVERNSVRLHSADLVADLVRLEEAPWGDLWGKPLEARRLAKILKPYGIGPKQIRICETTLKGYEAADFEDSWDRYIPPGRETSETGKQTTSAQSGDEVQGVSDVSLVSVPRGAHEATAMPESEEWEEGEI